ncbi:mandelate racemase/muconate lactonizing enzyme family protein [Paenibacillus sp. HWE-109]|uniref:mandelate racemase/muconate lactonizing enzyme family protein n=1 Tax=Paenibacillus sp. HWE-109 TaxID=1306526 RepID=UPI001EDFCA24|nr:mandelate racemase/muconate lactonizing enzyme family protein [Paenibacillus sp. HWE-109]UKS28787.1 mandelate racemase/muconate lactonizing enzyme family protein [Paenibacillus sp. HWE-109]
MPLIARFEDMFGGLDKVPESLLYPSSNFATYPRYGQYSTVVVITAEDGTTGVGEAFGLPTPKMSAVFINEVIGPMLIGKDPLHTSCIFEALVAFPEKIGHTRGVIWEAISGIDIALWDLKGKLLGVPVHTLIGGKQHERIECYASPVQFFQTVEETKTKAREFVNRGFRTIKLKVGRGIETDIAHVAAVREEVGPNIRLLLDMNCGYDVRSAIMFAKELEPYRIGWFEEPISPEDVDGLYAIHRAINVPLATGENEFSVHGFREILKRGAVDVIMPNISRCGGITGMTRINALAMAFGVKLSPHGVGGGIVIASSSQVMAAFKNSYLFEYNQLLNPLRHELIDGLPAYGDGWLTIKDEPGLGFSLNEETVRKFAANN